MNELGSECELEGVHIVCDADEKTIIVEVPEDKIFIETQESETPTNDSSGVD